MSAQIVWTLRKGYARVRKAVRSCEGLGVSHTALIFLAWVPMDNLLQDFRQEHVNTVLMLVKEISEDPTSLGARRPSACLAVFAASHFLHYRCGVGLWASLVQTGLLLVGFLTAYRLGCCAAMDQVTPV